jgi:ATP-dependent Lhr-like helicase
MDALETFHPVVRSWFERRFPEGATEPQAAGWPAIARGRHTLIAAPTGSGKTLAAFLVCIDRLIRDAEREGELADETRVVYVSPLKALATDIHHNLEIPLAEIRAVGREFGIELPRIRALVRTGDTTPSARASMLRRPPHLLITTPESLYLMVTAEKSRERLRAVRTVIVDEIHAVARDKRGAHGDRRRDPRRGPRQARRAPGRDAGAAGGALRSASGPDRSLGHPAPRRGGGAAAGREPRGGRECGRRLYGRGLRAPP